MGPDHRIEAPQTPGVQAGLAAMSAGLALAGRRSHAVADYWRTVAQVRDPGELLALQLSYWSQLMDDYAAAFGESVAPLGGPPPGEQAAPPIVQSARAA